MPEPLILQHLQRQGPNSAPQAAFFEAEGKHIAYGGARGGGKSWAMRRKLVMLCVRYAGLKCILFRRTMPELRENHIIPLQAELAGFAKYNADARTFTFPNGSRLVMGYCENEADVYHYQGQEYEVVGLEEATNFTQSQRDFLTTINRTTRPDFRPRMYYTANPGGVGHTWFKRLFIDRQYEKAEKAEDFVFIPASVYDNPAIMDNNPDYVANLEALPEDLRRAHLLGDWNVFAGQYFPEFRTEIHVVKPAKIPPEWRRYVAMDYGLDMLAAYWIAITPEGRAVVYREVYQPGLIVSMAAETLKKANGYEEIYAWLAPPDLWNRRQETGRSVAEIFADHGILLERTNNDRVQGWYDLKEWLNPCEDEQGNLTASLVFSEACPNIIRCLPQLQHDDKNNNDVSNTPHELTHGPDAIRGFVAGRPAASAPARPAHTEWEPDQWEDYENAESEAMRARMIELWGNPFA